MNDLENKANYMATNKVLIMAGGTGDHIFPALAVAEALAAQGLQIAWLGRRDSMEAEVATKAGFPLLTIEVNALRGKGWQRLLLAPWQLLRAIQQAWQQMRHFQPNLVLGFGGYASGPGGIAAFLRRTPLCIQEQNAIPGYTNRVLAKLSKQVFAAFPEAFQKNKAIKITGNPLRQAVLQVASPKERFLNHSGPIRILVMGGSQGAKALNDILPAALMPLLQQEQVIVRHQSGVRHVDTVVAAYKDAPKDTVTVMPFIDDIAAAYEWADFVIARAGAATVSELAAVGLGSILIPYPYAVDDHQTKNAAYLEKVGAARIIAEKNCSIEILREIITQQLLDRNALYTMAEQAYAVGRKEATHAIVTECLGVLGGKQS